MTRASPSDQSTPLHAAAYYGHGLICVLLISHGADASAINVHGNTPTDEAKDENVRRQIVSAGGRAEDDCVLSLAREAHAQGIVSSSEPQTVTSPDGKVVALYLRHASNQIPDGWMGAWHGTKLKYALSILSNGLQPSGTNVAGVDIKPPEGHYKLGDTHFGIENWARAIFVSPSLLYAGHPCYSERVLSGVDGDQWCVLIRACCAPDSFTVHDSTVIGTDPVVGEPSAPEWRVGEDVEGGDMIWRHNDAVSVVVIGVVMVRLRFFESIGHGGLTYERATQLLKSIDA
jgi:hypothetical protein